MKLRACEKYAWAGALFEGEGSVFCRRGRKGGRANVRQKYRDVLDTFQQIVKIGRVFGPYKNQTHCDMFHWQCDRFQDIQTLHRMLRRFLSARRLSQFEAVLANAPGPVGSNQFSRK